MIVNWLETLPLWAMILWFFGGAFLYPLGIELSKKYRTFYYCGISMIALVTTYTTMLWMTVDVKDTPGVSVLLIAIIAGLAALMVKWATPKKTTCKDNDENEVSKP